MSSGTVLPHRNRWPRIAPNAFIAPGSTVIGDVEMAPESSVWFNCAVRGDVNPVRIGPRSNVQDGTIIHTATKEGPTIIGADVVVGHMCLLHACILEDACMVGMGAIVMDYAVVETGAWVAAGALVPPGKRVRSGELWMGRPAKHVRDVSNSEREQITRIARNYVQRAHEYRTDLATRS
jgi:carbonic anhydrase/acetyltransferase-like protein (isoleucine patch superfamily)